LFLRKSFFKVIDVIENKNEQYGKVSWFQIYSNPDRYEFLPHIARKKAKVKILQGYDYNNDVQFIISRTKENEQLAGKNLDLWRQAIAITDMEKYIKGMKNASDKEFAKHVDMILKQEPWKSNDPFRTKMKT
jgi:hypothetical protein